MTCIRVKGGGIAKIPRFRSKVARMGDKFHIIVPKSYHKDIIRTGLISEFVDVKVTLE